MLCKAIYLKNDILTFIPLDLRIKLLLSPARKAHMVYTSELVVFLREMSNGEA